MNKRAKILYALLNLWLLYLCAGNLYSIWANIRFELTVPAAGYVRNLFAELAHLPAIIAGAADGSLLVLCLSQCLIYLTLPVAAVLALICVLRGGNRTHTALGWILLARGVLSMLQYNPGAIAAVLQQAFLPTFAALLVQLFVAFWSAALLLVIGYRHRKRSREIPGLIRLAAAMGKQSV